MNPEDEERKSKSKIKSSMEIFRINGGTGGKIHWIPEKS